MRPRHARPRQGAQTRPASPRAGAPSRSLAQTNLQSLDKDIFDALIFLESLCVTAHVPRPGFITNCGLRLNHVLIHSLAPWLQAPGVHGPERALAGHLQRDCQPEELVRRSRPPFASATAATRALTGRSLFPQGPVIQSVSTYAGALLQPATPGETVRGRSFVLLRTIAFSLRRTSPPMPPSIKAG